MDTLQKIGQVIKNLRQAHGLSQEKFCTECGIDQHYISNIENGQRNLSVTLVEKIANYFGLSLYEFFGVVDRLNESWNNDYEQSVSDSRKKPVIKYSSAALKNEFILYMKRHGLKARTINSYSDNTPNSSYVQTIIRSVTGQTSNMFDLRNDLQLEEIISRVSNSDFDRVGHSMYSAGLKKFRDFLRDSSLLD